MKIIFLFLFITFFFISCEYEPDETFSRELDENVDPPKLTIIGHQPEDPIILNNDTNLIFKFSATKNIRKIAFAVDDNSINQTITKDGMEGHNYLLNQGRYVITIMIYSEIGTTSIVDKIGAEGYKFETKWVIVSKGKYYSALSATIKNENAEIILGLTNANKP